MIGDCGRCIHFERCSVWHKKFIGKPLKVESLCEFFKNKADYVEVVRCKDCKYWHQKVYDPLIKHDIGECICPHWENDYFWYETNDNNFCSYGERKDT